MKNRGFTIMELLAVIVILGVLSSLVVIGVTKYRQDVKKKELINLHSTIEAAYDKYRSDLVMSGGSVSKKIDFNNIDTNIFDKYFSDFSYSGNRLTKEDLRNSVFTLEVKGDLLNNSDYVSGKTEDHFVKDGTCVVDSSVDKDNDNIVKFCKDSNGNYIPSQEEILCIELTVNGEKLIDDYGENSMQPLCVYFNQPNNVTNSGVVEE